MKRVDLRIAEALLDAPDPRAPYPGGLVALRRAAGCGAGELKDAVQRMRWAGRIRMDALQLTESMLPPTPKASAAKSTAPKRKSRGLAKEAEAEPPYSAAEGAGAATTDAPVPEADKVPVKCREAGAPPVPAVEGMGGEVTLPMTACAGSPGSCAETAVIPEAKISSAGNGQPTEGERPCRFSAPEQARAPSPAPAPPIKAEEPEIVAGCRMPTEQGAAMQDRVRYEAARQGSAALLKKLRAYAAKHHPHALERSNG